MNNLELFKQYTTLLDEVYKQSALTADLEGAPELAKQGANANAKGHTARIEQYIV